MNRMLYPIGIQSFSTIRERGYVYVDKTDYIWKLTTSGQFFFLSRPRRFGKSLLLSTIEELFLGHRDLFEGLDISHKDYDWQTYPVLHLDFTGNDYMIPGSVEAVLNENLRIWEQRYEVRNIENSIGERFRKVIKAANEKTGLQVVILIDEYDKPLLETVDHPELQEKFRNQLRAFYGNLKSQDRYIRFAMLTGVTKFGHLSIFSDLNNLQDISMVEEFAGICGITDEELHRYFEPGVALLGEKRGYSTEEAYDKLRLNYDGYSFSPLGGPDIYNPFSVLNSLQAGWIRDFWFQTGTPTFLVKLIKSRQIELQRLGHTQIPLQAGENVSFDPRSSLYTGLIPKRLSDNQGLRPGDRPPYPRVPEPRGGTWLPAESYEPVPPDRQRLGIQHRKILRGCARRPSRGVHDQDAKPVRRLQSGWIQLAQS